MQGLDDVGILFFEEVFQRYWGEIALYAVFLVAVLYSLCSKSKMYKRLYGYSACVALVTVFNPLLAGPLVKGFHMQERYYRFYWILPITLLVAMFLSGILHRYRKVTDKILAVFLISAIIILCGNFKSYGIDAKKLNIYKISEEVIEISKIIHSYAPEKESINVYCGWDLMTEFRTYDASICMAPVERPREHTNEELNDWERCAWNGSGYFLLTMIEIRSIEFPADMLSAAFDEYGINAYIRKKDHMTDDYIKSLGLLLLGQTDDYEIYWYQ